MPDTCHPTRAISNGPGLLPLHRVKRFGWKRDRPDARDKKLKLRVVKLASTIDLRKESAMPSVYDQGDLGSCTGNGIGGVYEFMQKLEGLVDYMPSRLFIYYGERVIEHSVSEDSGAEIRDGMTVVRKLGVPHESLWPYDISKFAEKPSAPAYQDGLLHQCIQYSRVNITSTDVKLALMKKLPVVMGFSVPASFEDIPSSGLWLPKKGEEIIGGHCVVIVGYVMMNKVMMAIVRNSWGSSWGDAGYFYVPMTWLVNPNNSSDFWVMQRVEA